MKIALVILHADPARGGAERYTADLATGLGGRGHTVSLLASTVASSPPAGIAPVVLAAGGRTRVGRYRAFLDSLDRHMAQVRYDIVHAMLPVRRCDIYHPHAGLAAEAVASGPPLSRWGNLLNRRRQHMATVERQLLQPTEPNARPPIVLCLSNYVKASVRCWYPTLLQDRLVRLFNGTDLDRFDPATRPAAGDELRRRLDLPPDAVVALMLAQDFQRKGLDITIRAAGQVADPRLHLLVAGRPDPEPYRRLAASLHMAERVHFAGQTDDPYAFYRAADYFVLPTRHDPCSLVVLEALAMGLPVISTVFNGACEVMEPGVHGAVLSDPSDIVALAASMRSLLDPQKRAAQSAACLTLRPGLSQTAHIDRLEAIYRSVAEESP